jgi:nucleoside-diphosphate-sugar epimerase
MNIVIGKNSNLSNTLLEKVDNVVLVSSRDIISNTDVLKKYKNDKKNIIFNNFHPSNKLNEVGNYINYIQNSIAVTAMVLEYFRDSEINKIVYSSSSSVYGDNSEKCKESDFVNPLNFYSSVKLANEMLIREYCNAASIDYTITRIFNMYGGNDNFSIINKIIQSYVNNSDLLLRNKGQSVRDFIHVDDVALIYSKLLNIKGVPILNVGTGRGISIASILDFLIKKGVDVSYAVQFQDEIATSISDNALLLSSIGNIDYVDVNNYLLEELDQ